MFLGTYTPKLDDKGRLTLPAKFRDELRGGLMITKGQDHCLYVFTREAFAEMAAEGGVGAADERVGPRLPAQPVLRHRRAEPRRARAASPSPRSCAATPG